MPVRECAMCGTRQMVPGQEHSFRCQACGSRVEVPASEPAADRVVRLEEEPMPPSRGPTILVDAADAVGEPGAPAPRAAVACPGCGTFTAERLCETCGQPIPRLGPLVPAASADTAERAAANRDPGPAGSRPRR